MKNIPILLFSFILLFGGCTKNNQNASPSYAYLSVNQTYSWSAHPIQSYDIDNDGQVDWGFVFAESGLVTTSNSIVPGFYSSFLCESNPHDYVKILPLNYTITSADNFWLGGYSFIWGFTDTNIPVHPSVLGTDFYIGFKSQNRTFTNSFYGWARLNLNSDGSTLIVKDMAINTVNGGSINVGQH